MCIKTLNETIMKVFNYILTMALGIFALASCSSNDDATSTVDSKNGKEIKLGYAVNGMTRSTYNLDTKLTGGAYVYAWIYDTGNVSGSSGGTESALYGATTYQHITGNILTPLNTTGSTIFRTYPMNQHTINIYAVHGNFSGILSQDMDYPTSALTYSVLTDQTTESSYAASDLMYGKRLDAYATEDTVALTFKHLLSKIIVVPKVDASAGFTIKKVVIMNTIPTATLTFNTTNRTIAPTVVVNGSAKDISISCDASTYTGADIDNEGIIIPQTVASGTKFLKVTLSNGTTYIYTLPSSMTFEAGKSYRFTVQLKESDISVGYTVDNWAAGNWDTSHPNGQEIFADQDE
jgi:hypothetical protein